MRKFDTENSLQLAKIPLRFIGTRREFVLQRLKNTDPRYLVGHGFEETIIIYFIIYMVVYRFAINITVKITSDH